VCIAGVRYDTVLFVHKKRLAWTGLDWRRIPKGGRYRELN
jgi:hypothetical protein